MYINILLLLLCYFIIIVININNNNTIIIIVIIIIIIIIIIFMLLLYYYYNLSFLCSIHLVGVGVVTLESGNQCIPVFFAEKRNDSALAGRYKICLNLYPKPTEYDNV